MLNKYLLSLYTVRFGDCDPFRHLNNARYLDYFLNAREDHLRDHYQMDLADLASKGQSWVVKEHAITYLRPAVYNERVWIGTALISAGPDHLLVEMLMMDESKQQLKALLHSSFVPINLQTGRKEPHAAGLMEFLEDKVISTGSGVASDPRLRAAFWQQELRGVTADRG